MKSLQIPAKVISTLFNPLLIPTIGIMLLMNSGFYFSSITVGLKFVIFVIVLLSTCITPLVSLLLMTRNEHFSLNMDKNTDRVLPLLFAAVFYYVGYYFLGRIQIFSVYRIFIISSIFIIVLLMIISIRWKISAHMAGIGGLVGILIALSINYGINHSILIALLVGAAGLIGTSRLILEKHSLLQIYAGFLLGFSINLLIFSFM